MHVCIGSNWKVIKENMKTAVLLCQSEMCQNSPGEFRQSLKQGVCSLSLLVEVFIPKNNINKQKGCDACIPQEKVLIFSFIKELLLLLLLLLHQKQFDNYKYTFLLSKYIWRGLFGLLVQIVSLDEVKYVSNHKVS